MNQKNYRRLSDEKQGENVSSCFDESALVASSLPPSSLASCVESHKTRETLSDVAQCPIPAQNSLSRDPSPVSISSVLEPLGSSPDDYHLGQLSEKNFFQNFLPASDRQQARFSPSDGAENQPPATCNTGGSIRHSVGGLDTLEVSLYGNFRVSHADDFFPRLLKARLAAESGIDQAAYVRLPEGDLLAVRPNGARHGVQCKFVCDWNGCVLAFVDGGQFSEKRLTVHVTIGSIRLMEAGHQVAWDAVMALLASIGYEHVSDIVGRADLCVDLPNQSMNDFRDAWNQDRVIRLARKWSIFGSGLRDDVQTISVGNGGSCSIRIYDKVQEVKNDPVKLAVMIEQRWNGQICEHATRVEFQLRNKALQKHFSIKSVADLFRQLGTVSQWCTGDWFRLTNEFDRENRNHDRAGIDPLWQTVREAFSSWTGEAGQRTPKPRRLIPDFQQMKQQAVGCVTSLMASVDDGREFLSKWIEIGKQFVDDAAEVIELKREKLAARSRVIYVPDVEIPF